MKYQKNDPIFLQRRRDLRINQTNVEKILWFCLRNKQLADKKFYRQYSLGPYIIDFYCPEMKLAIELDGSQHMETNNKMHDEKRTVFLHSRGIRVRRYWNNEVTTNLEGVLADIFDFVTHSKTS